MHIHPYVPFHNSYDQRRKTAFIVVHCSATPPTMDIGLFEIRQWHVAKGWYDVGYHYIIRRDGSVEVGRPHYAMGAHVRGHNQESLGICLVGGINNTKDKTPEDNFTAAQQDSLLELLDMVSETYPTAEIVGHRDLDKGKACPSFDIHNFIKEFNS